MTHKKKNGHFRFFCQNGNFRFLHTKMEDHFWPKTEFGCKKNSKNDRKNREKKKGVNQAKITENVEKKIFWRFLTDFEPFFDRIFEGRIFHFSDRFLGRFLSLKKKLKYQISKKSKIDRKNRLFSKSQKWMFITFLVDRIDFQLFLDSFRPFFSRFSRTAFWPIFDLKNENFDPQKTDQKMPQKIHSQHPHGCLGCNCKKYPPKGIDQERINQNISRFEIDKSIFL